jgi:hypothetical protein
MRSLGALLSLVLSLLSGEYHAALRDVWKGANRFDSTIFPFSAS